MLAAKFEQLYLPPHTHTRSGHIRGLEVGQDRIWTTHIKTPKIQVWDLEDGRHTGTLHCDVIVNSL